MHVSWPFEEHRDFGVLKLSLASLMHHSDYLRSKLPANHAVLQTSVFRDDDMMSRLKSLVRSSSATLKPTGLPPYVEIYRQLELQQTTLKTLSSEVVANIRRILDEKELTTCTVTPAYIDKLFSSIVECLSDGSVRAEPVATGPQRSRRQHMLYAWGGRLHKLPETFVFPSVDTATSWALWWLGKNNKVPYKTIDPDDLATKKQHRILSEWRYIMNILWQYYVTENRTTEPIESTEEAIVEAFECTMHALDPVPDRTPNKRERRFGQLMVVTVARIMREMNGAKT
ncbi:hypothetical protein DYB28_005428 [Aphanomyces astaci]|uniref:Uncharacterized protein n=1 Tax=Aphanomyces astaci TaxID=112090 RepID=A0A9X8DYV5_APHAT|nr:hypothetical protein DYB28_005428 [Aphanomyces astaci]